jgi:Fe-S oxidoreductase
VQNNEPEIGRDTLEVLDTNGVKTACLKGLQCCGMPAWEHGDLEGLRKHAHANLDKLMPFVDAGAKVLAVNPTCSMMMRREYPELLEGADRERAKKLAANVMDPSEFVWSLRAEARFAGTVKSKPNGPIAYHAPCHLRAQAVGFKSRDLFKKLLGATVVPVIECCGHDGTYAMTTEGFEPSQKAGQNAFRDMKGAGASTWSTDCPLAAIQFHQFAGVKPAHPMSILARAYRGDPFPPASGAGAP